MNLIYNVNFDIAGLIILFLVKLILKAQFSKAYKSNKVFNFVVNITFISTALDLITAYTISYALTIPCWINLIVNTLYFLSAYACTYMGAIYILESINCYTKGHRIFINVVAITYMIVLFINLFTGIVFDFKEHYYNKGIFYRLTLVVSLITMFDVGIVFILNHKSINPTKLLLNSSYIVFPIIFVCIQVFFPSYLFTNFCMSLIIFVMIFTLDTPDYYELEYLRKNLETEVDQQTKQIIAREKQIELMSVEMVQALAEAIDEKDEYTKGHSVRVAQYSVLIGKDVGLSEDKLKYLHVAALLHDIGKIGVPDSVLQKPSSLTKEEFDIIKQHTTNGGKILHNVTSLPYVEDVALHHHERYDGKGYPDQLADSEIPYFARIVAIADAYDAMSTKRVYRSELPREVIRQQLIQGRGTQFDPDLLDVFLNLFESDVV